MEAKVVLFREATAPPMSSGDTCVVMVGNLSEGYKVYGPFESFDEAAIWYDYASKLQYLDSWFMKLDSPCLESN